MKFNKFGLAVLTAMAASLVFVTSAEAAKYKGGTVDNGGVILGTVLFSGDVPNIAITIPQNDQNVCGEDREQPALTVGAETGVADVVVYLKKIDVGKAWPETDSPANLLNINCRFEPHMQVMRKGKLNIVNDDPVLHNTHGFYGERTAFNLALPNQGEEIKGSLKRAGFARLECDAHAWMRAYVYVAKNPYWAITDADGRFSLTDVPAGEYTLVVAQGRIPAVETLVQVSANGEMNFTIDLAE